MKDVDLIHENIRNALAQLVASGRLNGSETPSLLRCDRLINFYDMVSKKQEDGCVFAVYGSPKMGKSTLFNSIIGADVLPRRPIPTTGSVIDLRKKARKDYEVVCKRNGEPYWKHFKTPEMVCEFLDTYATQDNPCDSVFVTGPFPDAAEFITEQCVLRDTPGAEAILDATDRVVDERLKEDSSKTLQSLQEPCIPLFCVSAKTIGQKQDLDFYSNYFQGRCCLHVITRIDGINEDLESQEVLNIKDDFRHTFGIFPSETIPAPVVCTGIKDAASGCTRVNIGLEDLAREMQNLISLPKLGDDLRNVADYILRHDIDWDAGYDKEILFAQLEYNLNLAAIN